MNLASLHRHLLLLLFIAALGACGGGSASDGKDKPAPTPIKERLTIVCTTPIIREIVVRIVGDRHDVHCLMKSGEAIETFDLHPGDVQLIESADILFMHGQGLEGAALETVAAHVDRSKVIALAEGSRVRNRPERETIKVAPHCWANPWLYGMLVEEAKDALCGADAKNQAVFASRAQAYAAELAALVEWAAKAGQRERAEAGGVVTNLPALVELARFIGQPALELPLDPTRQPTLADRDRLVAAVKERAAHAIAIDPGNNPALAEMLMDAARATGARVVSPAMTGLPRDENETYIAWMKANVETLVKAMK
jgi:zinc/manganese transport system substrate-binding protein